MVSKAASWHYTTVKLRCTSNFSTSQYCYFQHQNVTIKCGCDDTQQDGQLAFIYMRTSSKKNRHSILRTDSNNYHLIQLAGDWVLSQLEKWSRKIINFRKDACSRSFLPDCSTFLRMSTWQLTLLLIIGADVLWQSVMIDSLWLVVLRNTRGISGKSCQE